MRVLGLTGGIGMGKSTTEGLLRQKGIRLVDTDAIAHELVEPGQAALEKITEVFGRGVLGTDGRLQRSELARMVFNDPAARTRLEGILHPPIRAAWKAKMDVWRGEGCALAVVVIPLLFETQAQKEFDATACVLCSASTQEARLRARGWSPEHIAQRVRAQWPAEKKAMEADFVIWNEAGLDVLREQIERVLASS